MTPAVLHEVPRATDMRDAARAYLEAGYAIVPLLPGDKRLFDKGWQERTYTLDDVKPDSNLGLKCNPPVVDIDCLLALKCADDFLPRTSRIDGRVGKPRSHRVFHAELESEDFKDIDQKHSAQVMLVQVLSGCGKQAVVPPSLHESGERRIWEDGSVIGPPASVVDGSFLRSQVVSISTVSLIARHWPARGIRRELRLAYARVLLETLKLDVHTATSILEWACRLGGSDDNGIKHAASAVRDTKEALAKNENAIGGKTVAKLLPEGDKLLSRLREWYGVGKADEVASAIARVNERFAIVSVGNKVVVMETWPDGGIKALWPFEEFRRLLIKDYIEVEARTRSGEPTTKRIPLASIWLAHKDGRRYDRLVYAMPGSEQRCETDDYNGWLGFTVAPQAGDWSRNREHLQRIICAGNEKLYVWLWNWMAALVQQPGRHAFTAVVLRGGQGIGKGHFAHLMLGALFHQQQYLHIIGAGMLTGRFNEHLSGKVLVFADESTWGGDPAAADKLKGMVTESTIPIERKFLPLVEELSALHIVIASNNEWPIAIAMDDRRFMVLDVVETERQNDAYFTPLRDELRRGGLSALLHDLLAHPVDEYALRHPPSTKGKREVMAQSLKPIERWWYEKLMTGSLSLTRVGEDGNITYSDGWPGTVQKAALHEDYLTFLTKHHETRTRRSTETELGMFLTKFTKMQSQRRLPGVDAGAEKDAGKTRYFWDLPTLDECRAHWAKVCDWPEEFRWDEEGQ